MSTMDYYDREIARLQRKKERLASLPDLLRALPGTVYRVTLMDVTLRAPKLTYVLLAVRRDGDHYNRWYHTGQLLGRPGNARHQLVTQMTEWLLDMAEVYDVIVERLTPMPPGVTEEWVRDACDYYRSNAPGAKGETPSDKDLRCPSIVNLDSSSARVSGPVRCARRAGHLETHSNGEFRWQTGKDGGSAMIHQRDTDGGQR